jgi:hypothetical protein
MTQHVPVVRRRRQRRDRRQRTDRRRQRDIERLRVMKDIAAPIVGGVARTDG